MNEEDLAVDESSQLLTRSNLNPFWIGVTCTLSRFSSSLFPFWASPFRKK